VLEPLGLRQSFFAPQEIRRLPHAAGHATTGAEPAVPVSPLFLPRNADPAGGLWSTTHDQLRYARSHLGQRTAGVRPLLQPETLQSMRTPQVFITSPQPIRLGLSWLLNDVGGVPVMIHDGDTFGLHADLFLAPEHDFAFVLLTNAIPAGAIVAQPVLAEALVRYGLTPAPGAAPAGADGGPAPAPPGQPAVPPALALPPEALAAYAGRYRIPPATIELRVVGDALLACSEIELVPGQIVPTSPTTPSGALELPQGLPVTFVREDVATISLAGQPAGTFAFVRRPDGSVGWMRSGVRLIPRVDPPC
jgi:CubicO group peptidase (beta-lactamase class C family)